MVTRLDSGEWEFRTFVPLAAFVEILGTFTGWHDQPLPMLPDGAGWWTARLPLDPGEHEFQYRIDGRMWQADYAAHGVRLARHGAWMSRLSVPRVSAMALADAAA